jgi:flavin-dependent dehydrogenase
MEIRDLKEQFEEPSYIRIYISEKISPGGYYWIFPKDGTKVNVGIGIQMAENFPEPRNQLYKYVLNTDAFKDSKLIRKGTWLLPTRRPISSMVANGIIIIGDAACQTNPVHGGGMGPSMVGGKLAAEVGSKAIERSDLSRNALWPFNLEFIKYYGAKSAALDVFRIFLQKCGDDEFSYGMENQLITEDDVLKASLGEELHLNITDKALRVFRGLRKLHFLRQLNLTTNKMKEIKALYYNYPNPEGLEEWNFKVQRILSEMKAMNF